MNLPTIEEQLVASNKECTYGPGAPGWARILPIDVQTTDMEKHRYMDQSKFMDLDVMIKRFSNVPKIAAFPSLHRDYYTSTVVENYRALFHQFEADDFGYKEWQQLDREDQDALLSDAKRIYWSFQCGLIFPGESWNIVSNGVHEVTKMWAELIKSFAERYALEVTVKTTRQQQIRQTRKSRTHSPISLNDKVVPPESATADGGRENHAKSRGNVTRKANRRPLLEDSDEFTDTEQSNG